MNRTFRLYGLIFLILLALLALAEFSRSEITDWRKNFSPEEKTPFGLYIFAQEAPKLFGNKLKKVSVSPYEYYAQSKDNKPHNLLIVAQDIDPESFRSIVKTVSGGSDAFIISDRIYRFMTDSLQIRPAHNVNFDEQNTLGLTDISFRRDSLLLDKFPGRYGFLRTEKSTEILGSVVAGKRAANFVRKKIGKGYIYIHTEPLVLTNYYLLKPGNERYVQDIFSYLPDRETVWFTESARFESRSLLRFVLSQPALRYAWWLLLGGLLLFVVFNAKRRQRIVPVKEPVKNKSVEFVQSIGNLYLQEGDFHDMMAKKAQYFLNRVRAELLIDTKKTDEEFAQKLQLKTGKSPDLINEALILVRKAGDPYAAVMKEDLIRMNRLLDDILKR